MNFRNWLGSSWNHRRVMFCGFTVQRFLIWFRVRIFMTRETLGWVGVSQGHLTCLYICVVEIPLHKIELRMAASHKLHSDRLAEEWNQSGTHRKRRKDQPAVGRGPPKTSFRLWICWQGMDCCHRRWISYDIRCMAFLGVNGEKWVWVNTYN